MAPSDKGRTRSARRSRTTPCNNQLEQSKPSSNVEVSACFNRPEKQAETTTSVNNEAEGSALTVNLEAESSASIDSSKNPSTINGVTFENSILGGCSTPKGKKFRIPDILTCPPAPKKRRPIDSNCVLRRNPISFYASPDLELFLFFAVQDIRV